MQRLLGAKECTSPFGAYELSMPIDDTIPCSLNSSLITHKNCREFDVSFKSLHCFKSYELKQHVSYTDQNFLLLQTFVNGHFAISGHETTWRLPPNSDHFLTYSILQVDRGIIHRDIHRDTFSSQFFFFCRCMK